MKIVVVSGEKQVSISAKGASPKLLAEMEQVAVRLLDTAPEAPKKQPFGFSCEAETEVDETPLDEAFRMGGYA